VISRFFIERPVFASVLSIVIVLAGLFAMRALPIAQYPQIVPPEVLITASYPGATAETISQSVAAPLEQQINGVENMLYMRSTSTDSGTLRLIVTFQIGTDPDQATINVNNRVQRATALLPEEVRRQGVTVRKQSSSILQILAMSSPTGRYDPIFISNYALINVIDELRRTPGVGDASLFGASDYSMRIWLRPDKVAQYNLTPSDIAGAIREQNARFAAGRFGEEPMSESQAFTYSVTTPSQLADPREFENIIVRSDENGGALRLKDVARVELGSLNYAFRATYNGAPTVPIGVYLQPGANAIEVAAAVKQTMDGLAKRFPDGLRYDVPFNTTRFIEFSINEVIHTFVEAIALVVLVVFIFLQNWRATLIPVLAVPVSLIGTFAGMYLLGFSINLLTLFGMVLAIGIVVDDAIVVLENVERIMTTEHKLPREAAIQAMQEVSGPVIAIVLVLCAVFIPVSFLGGLAGELYRQFAVTIAVSVVISGVVALTLTPALCAVMLKPTHGEPWQSGIRLRPRDGLPDPCRPVRALVAAAGRADRGAVRGVRSDPRDLPARPPERRLLPDRSRDADRPCSQERHPDRGVRRPAPSRRPQRLQRSHGRGAAALSPHHHDLPRVHSRRVAACDQHRRGIGEPALDRHRRDRRHAGGDLPGDPVRAALLPAGDTGTRAAERERPGACPGHERRRRTEDRTSWESHLKVTPANRRAAERRRCRGFMTLTTSVTLGSYSRPNPFWELRSPR
jgi:multidrug efflux pump subunit AcrB